MVRVHPSALREIRWYEYAVRFLFGGLITVAAGLVAKEFGPGVGGLFLAFPAIFPASATLIEKHERERKQQSGLRGEKRARGAASLDAAGAARGSIGLMVFALLIWRLLALHRAAWVFGGSAAVWFGTAIAVWYACRLRHRFNH